MWSPETAGTAEGPEGLTWTHLGAVGLGLRAVGRSEPLGLTWKRVIITCESALPAPRFCPSVRNDVCCPGYETLGEA